MHEATSRSPSPSVDLCTAVAARGFKTQVNIQMTKLLVAEQGERAAAAPLIGQLLILPGSCDVVRHDTERLFVLVNRMIDGFMPTGTFLTFNL